MAASDIVTGISGYPLTQQRAPPVGLDQELPNPGLPRANLAISKENQKGSPPELARRDLTVMQQVRASGHNLPSSAPAS
jgi:peroxygenase